MSGRGIGLWGETLTEAVEWARAAEAAGFGSVWNDELHRSAFVPLAGVATATSRIQLCLGIALAFTRSPLITALTALDLDELSGGRFTLGLGSGVQRLNEDWHNVPFGKAVPHLRETVALVRLLMAQAHRGEPIAFQGDYYQVNIRGYRRPYKPVRERLPIILAGVGPAMLALAGEVADGWLGHELNSPEFIRDTILPRIASGIARSGRARAAFDARASVVCAISTDGREARRQAAGTVAFYATVRTYAPLFAFHGFGEEAARIQQLFRAGDHAGMVDAVPDAMVDTYTAAGTVDEVRARLRRYEEVADSVRLAPPRYFVEPEVTRSQLGRIIERLAT